MKRVAVYRAAGLLSATLALGLVGVFGVNLLKIATFGAPPDQLLVRMPNLNWDPLAGAIVTSILAVYLIRKSRAPRA